MNNSVAVCVLFYQKLNQTIDCIESFSIDSAVKVYVLNNGSDEASFEKLKDRLKARTNVVYFDAGQNLGPARGRNFLISKVTEDWIVFTDNDITVTPEKWAAILKANITTKPTVEIFLPKLFNVHENEYGQFAPFYLKDNQIYDSPVSDEETNNRNNLNWFPSGASIVRRTFFEEVGVFDDNLFAFEDYEMGIRCIKSGKELRISFLDEITFVHDHKFQESKSDKNAVLQRYNTQKLESSFSHIEQKFGIKLNHDWRYWTNSQINLMTKSKSRKLIDKLINKFSKLLK